MLGLALALIGGLVVGLNDSCTIVAGRLSCPSRQEILGGKAFLGDLLALGGAFMGAGYILVGRRLRENLSLLGYITIVYGIAAVILIGFAVLSGQPLVGFPPLTYFWFVCLAVFPQLLGHSSFNWALRYLSAGFVAVVMLAEPVGSTILAYFFLGESPTWIKLGGAILILAGIYLASRSEPSA
jgi:drug/metabolite transporter (DMT)-like permease